MSQNLAQLCSLLIEDTYGPLYAHIFSTLTTHGRLSARDISQKCCLPLRQVIAGLATLVQCLFVFHHTTTDGRTSYQANPAVAFNLVRVGRFIQLMRHKFGHEGAQILCHLLIFGHGSFESLQKIPTWTKDRSHSYGFGLGEDGSVADDYEADRLKSLRRLLEQLIEQEYLIELQSAHFQTWSDTWRTAEMVVKSSGTLSNTKGKKAHEEFEEAVRTEVERRIFGQNTSGYTTANGKREASDDIELPSRKKQKRVNGVSNAAKDISNISSPPRSDLFNSHSIFRVNHSKLLLVLRHLSMARRVRQRMGSEPGQILAALLRQCENLSRKEGDLQQPPPSEGSRSEDRFFRIDMDQLRLNLNAEHATHGAGHRKYGRNAGLMNGHVNGGLSYEIEIDTEELDHQIATLAEGSCDFICRDEAGGGWNIDVNDAEDRLRTDEILQMVKQRFGLMSLRVIRILISRGKVDEKTLQEIGLLNAKDLRRCLAQLNAHGFIDLQEVPREPQRQPARTIYLWFYDAERVRKRVLESLYKSMCRLLERLKVERQKVGSTLQKAERTDVKGKEDEMLKSDEVELLKHWRRKEMWHLSELERLGCSVDILQTVIEGGH